MNFNFVASDSFDINVLNSVERFINHFPDFQTVWLTSEEEFQILLDLMRIPVYDGHELEVKDFIKYWDLSDFKFPELDAQQFDKFYEKWIEKSNRENNMDEFGNLIFLHGLSSKWNKLKYRLVVKESS